MEDYVNVYDYVGNENSTTTANKKEHEMFKTPRNVQQQIQINQTSTSTSENGNTKDTPKKILLVMLILVILIVSLAAIVLSIVSYNASGSKIVDQFNSYKMDMEFKLMQLNSKLQNSITQLRLQLDAIDHLAIIEQAQSTRLHCGPGLWYSVAYLNMSDPSQQCPTPWRKYGTGNIRVCGRAYSIMGSCSSVTFPTAGTCRPYSRVCGRVIGYQVASPDAFRKIGGNDNINFDGINITYGTRHHHIWSYVAGATESSSLTGPSNCPCSTVAGKIPPSFIGNRYYCESGNPMDTYVVDHLYSNDPLWDGLQCEGTCCTGTNSPPWFSVQLPVPTTDAIEVSICCDQSANDEDVPAVLLELHVQ